MTVFWIVAALFLAGALLLLLPPLWRPRAEADVAPAGSLQLAVYRAQWQEAERDLAEGRLAPERAEEARDDIRRRWLDEATAPATAAAPRPARRTAIALALLVPLASVLTYRALGDPQALAPPAPAAAARPGADGRHSVTREQIEAMVGALAERLKAEPGDAEGWMMLGRSYTALGRHRDAVTAFGRANQLAPGNPALLADFADVLAMAQGRRLAGEPARLIQQALDADPRHVKALALAGSAAFEARDYTAARGFWERLEAVVPAGSDTARSVQGSLAEARRLEAGGPSAAPAAPSAVVAAAAAIDGEISLDPALAARVAPGDTLFVFARAVQGPRMPLAIVRRPVGAWPAPFVLDDSNAMSPERPLSGAAQVVVGVRISRSGNATPQPGDLVGQSEPVTPGTRGLRIVVAQVQP